MGRQGEIRYTDIVASANAAGLIPATVAAAVAAADRGQTRYIVDLCKDAGRRDEHFLAVLGARQSCLTGRKWTVFPGHPGNGYGAKKCQRIADDASEMLACLPYVWGSADRPQPLGGLNALIWDLQDAVIGPLAWAEKSVDNSEGGAEYTRIDWVHPKLARWQLSMIDASLGDLHVLTNEAPELGVPIDPERWIVHQVRVTSDYPWRSGCAVAICFGFSFGRFGVDRWMHWLDRFGDPTPIAEVDPLTDDVNRDRISLVLQNLGRDGYAVVDELKKLHLESVSGQGDQAYERFIGWRQRSQSKLLLGHSASADAVSGQLGNTGSTRLVLHDLVASDGQAIDLTIGNQVVAPWVKWNNGDLAPIPRFELDTSEPLDLSETLRQVALAQAAGHKVRKSWFVATTGIPEGEGDDILAPLPLPGQTPQLDPGGRPRVAPNGAVALPGGAP